MVRTFAITVTVAAMLALGAQDAIAEPASSGVRFKTNKTLDAHNVLVRKPFDRAVFGRLAYVKVHTTEPALDRSFVETIQSMQVFESVQGPEAFQRSLVERSLASGKRINFEDNLVSLHNIEAEIGPFLIIEPGFEFRGGFLYDATIKAIDPRTAEVLFFARNSATNWAGLNGPLFNPLFNAFLDWTQAKPPPVGKR